MTNMKRMLVFFAILIALFSALPSTALTHEDIYGEPPEKEYYSGPHTIDPIDPELMADALGCLAFVTTGYIAWVWWWPKKPRTMDDEYDNDVCVSFFLIFLVLGAFIPFSMLCAKHLGSGQDIVWLGIHGYAIHLFLKRRKER